MLPCHQNRTRHCIQEVWDKENPAAVEDFLAPHFKRHRSLNTDPLTRDGQKKLLHTFREAFPDITITVEHVISEGNYIAFRSTMRGTHQGKFLGIPPTGKKVTVSLFDEIRIENGKFVEQWGGPDIYDLRGQLGASFSTDAN